MNYAKHRKVFREHFSLIYTDCLAKIKERMKIIKSPFRLVLFCLTVNKRATKGESSVTSSGEQCRNFPCEIAGEGV